MAKQPRKTHTVFASGGVVSNPTAFAQFGSLVQGSPLKTTDILVIQDGAAWTLGFQDEIYNANKAILLEDLNGWAYEHSYQVGQIFQDGIPEWDNATKYQIGSWVQDASGLGQVFQCLANNTVGGSLPIAASNGLWRWVNPPIATLSGALAVGTVPKIGGPASVGPANSQTLVAGLLSDDGTYVTIGGAAGTTGIKFSDATIQKTAAAPLSTRFNGLGLRVLGTTYTNSTGKAMRVDVTISGNASGGSVSGTGTIVSSGNLVVSSASVAGIGSSTSSVHIGFFVLPGETYKVTASQGVIAHWIEVT